jgi:hypothetical protein
MLSDDFFSPRWVGANLPVVAVSVALLKTFARPSLASDAEPLHRAHHRHRIPQITAAGRRNVAVGQLLRDVAIRHLPHLLQDNHLLTKLDYLERRAFGARVLACRPAGSVGVDPWPLTRKKSSPSQITAR